MHTIHFLPNILILLATAVIVVALFRRLNLSPVLGYFVAGSLIGDHGIGFFKDFIQSQETAEFAEFGVIFLLFAIGLELSFERLKSMRSHVFGFGSAQLLITSLVFGVIMHFMKFDINAIIVTAIGLSLSSTAIVLQVIDENRMQSTQVGRLSIAVLIMQDFAVVPLLIMIPLLAEKHPNIAPIVGVALLKAFAAMIIIFLLGRLLLRPAFSLIISKKAASSNELFVATTLLIALGFAWGTEKFNMSLALGAFIAGLLVAETEFQHQAEESIAPFKGIFLGLFFMTVGMSINVKLIIDNLFTILSLVAGIIILKALIITVLSLIFRFKPGSAIHSGLLLSQSGEFAFILFGLARQKNILEPHVTEILLLTVTFTMALTPLLSVIGKYISDKFFSEKPAYAEEDVYREVADIDNHIIVCGFGPVGRMVSRVFQAEKIPFVALDLDTNKISEGRSEGFPVYLGDATKTKMLSAVGLERAAALIITFSNEVTANKTIKESMELSPDTTVIVRARDLSKAPILQKMGVNKIIPESYEMGLQLGGAALKSLGLSDYEIDRIKNQFRMGNYLSMIDNSEDKKEA